MPERELVELLDREAFNLVGRITQCDPELKRSYERFIDQLAEVSARKKNAGAEPDLRNPAPSLTDSSSSTDAPPKSVQGPTFPPRVPPLSAEERKRAAELEKAKADWAEQDELRDVGPKEYQW